MDITKDVDLRNMILKRTGSVNSFAVKMGLSAPNVHYWCTTDWHRLNYRTREKIQDVINKYDSLYAERVDG